MTGGFVVLNPEEIAAGDMPVKAWVNGVFLEAGAIQQAKNLAKLPFISKHVALMPDAHVGTGSTIGSVIPTKGAIIPAAVGVDLGCGMMAVRTNWTADHLDDDLAPWRSAIESAVPHGRTNDGGSGDRGAWHDVPAFVDGVWSKLQFEWMRLIELHPALDKGGRVNHRQHLGTLGTGNHFIEVCLDESQRVWVVLHSGSRGVGNRIGTHFINLAKRDMQRYFINLPDSNLAYLPEGSEHFGDYVRAVSWAQYFAKKNRELMMEATLRALGKVGPSLITVEQVINCHHNYVEEERHFGQNVWVTRKGAVRAQSDDLGIIPGSMAVGSFIVRGKGNRESFNSCSHGAGRCMSRTEARKRITLADHIHATAGVECRKDLEVIDESPAAYKDLTAVMAAQSDLIEIVHQLKPVLCVKG